MILAAGDAGSRARGARRGALARRALRNRRASAPGHQFAYAEAGRPRLRDARGGGEPARARSARSASTTTTTSRRATCSRRSSARRCGWRASSTCPVVIHTREADEDTIAILREEGGGALRGVLHCFTGDAALADAGLDLGFYISLAGIVTFPKAAELRETARACRSIGC